MKTDCASPDRRGVQYADVLDAMLHDPARGTVTLVMFEPRPWAGGEWQMFELQEKLNAYLSFALDGEMLDTFPHLAGQPVRVELVCAEAPPDEAVDFLRSVREQIAFQGIDLEVVIRGAAGCGEGCGCHAPGGHP